MNKTMFKMINKEGLLLEPLNNNEETIFVILIIIKIKGKKYMIMVFIKELID